METNQFINKITQGHTLELLKQLDSDSIDCIITSPPYYGLRAYPNSETIWDEPWLDEKTLACFGHEWGETIIERTDTTGFERNRKGLNKAAELADGNPRQATTDNPPVERKSNFCIHCGAWKGQLGLEPDYKMYLNHMLQITAELRRVLKPSGTLWWNMGDTYAGSGNGYGGEGDPKLPQGRKGDIEPRETNIPDKCLMQLPERLAIRMVDEQDWILRNAIIWHKPNHMPSSVKDRLAGSYEFVHLFVKNKKYHFDLDAIREPTTSNPIRKWSAGQFGGKGQATSPISIHDQQNNPLGKNPGDILEDFWTLTTQPHPFAHFAVYPERLVEPMIKAGCPKNGIVLDPFAGSATTCLVAEKLKRNWIGFEINPEYIKIAEERLKPYVNQVKL